MASKDAASTSAKDASTQEGKEKKSFQPFKKVKKFFKRKKQEDGRHVAKKSKSTSELDQPLANEPFPPSNSAPLNTTLSQSHDSVFSPAQDADARPSGSTDGLAQSVLLKDELSKRVKSRQSSGDSEDEGLPRSPYNVSSTSDVHPVGVHAKSSFSKASSSDNSLLSIGSLEVDEMEVSVREEAAIDFDMDPTHLSNLSNTAARHKIAVRPKQRRRRTFKPIPEDPLPPTPEVVEDSGNEEESALVSSSLMGSSMEQSVEIREPTGSTTATEAKISNKKLKKQKKEEKKTGIKRKLSKKEQKLNKSDSSDKDEEAGFFSRMMRSFRRMSSRESKSVPNSPIHNVDTENVDKTTKHKSTSQLESVSWAIRGSEPAEKSVSSRFLKKDEVRIEKQVTKVPKSSLIKTRMEETAKQTHKNLDGKSSDVRRAQSAKSPSREKTSMPVDVEPAENLLIKSAKSQSLTGLAVDVQQQQLSHFEKRPEEKYDNLQTVPRVIQIADYSAKPSAQTKLVDDPSGTNHAEKISDHKAAIHEDVVSQERESELAKATSKMTKMVDSKRLDTLEKKETVLEDAECKMYGGVQLHKPANKQQTEIEPSSTKEASELSSVFARLSMKSDEVENIVDTYILRTADKTHVIFDSSKESIDDQIKIGDENKCDTICLDEDKQSSEQLSIEKTHSESVTEDSKAEEKLDVSPVSLHQTESFLDEILTELSNTKSAEPLPEKEQLGMSESSLPEQLVLEQKEKEKPETTKTKVLIPDAGQVSAALPSDATTPTKLAEMQLLSSKPPPARQAEKPRIISAKPQLVPKPNRVSSSGKSVALADDDKIASSAAKRSSTQPIPKADVEEAQTSLPSFAQTDQQQKRSYTQPVSDAEVAQAQVSVKSNLPLRHEKVDKKTSIPVTRSSNLRSRQTSLDESFSRMAQQSSSVKDQQLPSAKDSVAKEGSFDEKMSPVEPEKEVVITQLMKPSEIPRQTKLPSVSGSQIPECQNSLLVSKTSDEHSESTDEHQPKPAAKPSEIPRAIKQPIKTDESNVIPKPKIRPPNQPSKLPRKQPVTSPTSESTSDTPAWVLLAQKKHQKFKAVHEQKLAKSSCDSENIV